mmetsp:Transcript_16892/g.53955  ORF Transcript_16892/g.53955 Transcript_16892/m.53955 type:complete len:639 (+) Transcript_16892:116-2032(+)
MKWTQHRANAQTTDCTAQTQWPSSAPRGALSRSEGPHVLEPSCQRRCRGEVWCLPELVVQVAVLCRWPETAQVRMVLQEVLHILQILARACGCARRFRGCCRLLALGRGRLGGRNHGLAVGRGRRGRLGRGGRGRWGSARGQTEVAVDVGEVLQRHVLLLHAVRHFGSEGAEVLDPHQALGPLVGRHEGDLRGTDAVCVVECLGDLFRSVRVDIHGLPSLPQAPCDAHRLPHHVQAVGSDNKVHPGGKARNDLLLLEQLHDHAVAEAKAHAGDLLRGAEQLQQPVIPPAAADGPQDAGLVEALEDHARVVSEAAHDGRVELDPVAVAVVLRQVEEHAELLDLLAVPHAGNFGKLVERLRSGGCYDLLANVLAEADRSGELLQHCVRADLVQLVDHDARRLEVVVRHAGLRQHGPQDLAGVDLEAHIPGRDAHALEEGDDRGEELRLGIDAVDAHDVHVPLVVLPLAAALGGLKPPALRDGEPLQRQLGGHLTSLDAHQAEHHPRERGRHLGPQGHSHPVLVLEVVHLLRDLLGRVAGLELVDVLGLEHGSVVLLEPIQGCCLPELVIEPALLPHVLREEVTRAAGWFQADGGLVPLLLRGILLGSSLLSLLVLRTHGPQVELTDGEQRPRQGSPNGCH